MTKWLERPKTSAKVPPADFALPRGVLVGGKVTEAGTGKAVAGAVVYFIPCRADNPYYRDFLAVGPVFPVRSDRDGRFQIAVLPGPGHLLAKGPTAAYVPLEVGKNPCELRVSNADGECVEPGGEVVTGTRPPPPKPTVELTGLKANQIHRLQHIYRRKVPAQQIVTQELARYLCELSLEINRQIGVLIDRKGMIDRHGALLVADDVGNTIWRVTAAP